MVGYIKEFDRWNEWKKRINTRCSSPENLPRYINEREAWWCSVGVNVGSEIDGKNENFERPVLVVKRFNASMFWGVPLTSKKKDHPYVVAVRHDKGVSYANISQLRLFSSARMIRKIGMVLQEDFAVVSGSIARCMLG